MNTEHTHPAGVAGEGTPLAGAPGDLPPVPPGVDGVVTRADHDAAMAQLAAERDEMRDTAQRLAADFENFKRRAAQAREHASAAAETRLLGELLTVIDDTERALEHAGKDTSDKQAVADGLTTVHARLTGVVSSHGLERIDTTGMFDANLHEAMMVQAAPAGEADDTILQELQSGWKLGDRVLRHARVIVAGGGS